MHETKEFKDIPAGKVLIRVLYAAVEQLDRAILAMKPLEGAECALGAEGCGVIERVGPGVDESLRGKKCAFSYGAWQTFLTRDADKVIVFQNQSISERSLARAFVNPLTALCLRDRIKTIITSEFKQQFNRKIPVFFLGAESSVGRILNRLTRRMNSHVFEFVPIFRNSGFVTGQDKSELQGTNFFYLNNEERLAEEDITGFLKDRMDMPAIVIDAWANKATSQLIKLLPSDSRAILLGNLSEKERLSLDTVDLFMHSKHVEGFNLLKYLQDCVSKERRKTFYDFIREDFDSNPDSGDVFKDIFISDKPNEPTRVFKLTEVEDALRELEKDPGANILLECCSSSMESKSSTSTEQKSSKI